MALFQPFKKTTGRPAPEFMQAALEQHKIDQMAKQHENQVRNQMYGGATDLGVGLYGEYKDDKSPIGEYLRNMGGGDAEVDPMATDPMLAETDAPLQSPTDYSGQADYMGTQAAPMGNGGLFSDTYTPPTDIGMSGAAETLGPAGGAEEVAADDSLRGTLESLFAQFGGDAGTDAAIEGGTDALMDQGTEQLAQVGAEGAAEAAGASSMPGVGSLVDLAQGDVEGAATKYALSMLPPPYNMLAMFV